jgi:hypothetical protein
MKALLAILIGASIFVYCGVHVLDHRRPESQNVIWVIGTAAGAILGLYGLIANHYDHIRRR